jgi:hypothetical protein
MALVENRVPGGHSALHASQASKKLRVHLSSKQEMQK